MPLSTSSAAAMTRSWHATARPKGTCGSSMRRRSRALYGAMGPAIEISGGSAANTMVGLASFGGRAAFIGKVAGDEFGKIFRHDITSAGVKFDTAAGQWQGPHVAFAHSRHAGRRAHDEHVPWHLHRPRRRRGRSRADPIVGIVYLEGYLFDRPEAKAAFRQAAAIAKTAGRRVALTLSDSFCVDRHRAEFLDLIRDRYRYSVRQ